MGTRANVLVKGENEQVCLYTHWQGAELPETLREALRRGRDRWEDFPYLARIIFCEMIRGGEMETTGFGISQTIGDGGNRVLTVDVDAKTVQVNSRPPVSFTDYISDRGGWQ